MANTTTLSAAASRECTRPAGSAADCSSGNTGSWHLYQYMGSYFERPPASSFSRAVAGHDSWSSTCHDAAAAASAPTDRRPPPDVHFERPALRSSFPVLLHPLYPTVKAQCDEWTHEVAQPQSVAARSLLLGCQLPLLLCRSLPRTPSLQRLVHVVKMISWLTLADDDDDHPDVLGSDYEGSARFADLVMAILSSSNTTYINKPGAESRNSGGQGIDEPVQVVMPSRAAHSAAGLRALAGLWEEISAEMSLGLRRRFISTMMEYFEGLKVQAAYRKAHCLPDLQAYIKIRRLASFTLPAFTLVEYAMEIELDEDAYADPAVTEFRNCAMDFICLCNDIVSCRTEIGVGDYFNMPSIIYASASPECRRPMSFQDAIDRVAEMVADLDARCVALARILLPSDDQGVPESISSPYEPSRPAPRDDEGLIKAYVAELCCCMSGCLAWFLESARYHPHH